MVVAPFRHRQIFGVWREDEDRSWIGSAEEEFDDILPPKYDDDRFYDQRYAKSPTAEPLSEAMVRLMRSQLATLFYERIALGYTSTYKFRFEWHEYTYNGRPTLIRGFKRPRLPTKYFTRRSRPARDHLLEYADVHVAVYFDWFDKDCQTRHLGRYIWRKWFHLHQGRPPFLGYQKFAKPIALIMGSEPRSIKSVRDFHRSLCDAVSVGLRQQELPKPSPPTRRFSRLLSQLRIPPSSQSQSQLTNLRTYEAIGREMAHVFRAIVIIVDNQVSQYREPETRGVALWSPELQAPYTQRPSMEKRRDWSTSQYSVLLLRTRDDAHLSCPISFQSLYDSGKALTLDRPDCNNDGMNVVRVKIDTALEFVFDLIVKEREMVPHVGLAANIENEQHLQACEKWVDGVIEEASIVGIDENGFTWEAIRRAKAAINGEAFSKNQINPVWNTLGTAHLGMDYVDPPDEL
ncbi:hypothetical protein F4777DRAFT_576410 [Nemania sp. FL0916]|nr:hypothetical protein F4777DRAFT_576410 [Nemania sp. FL0916]